MRPPRVLISYSHDSPEHKEAVFRLSERLRKDGVDAWIDQYEPDPDIGWPSWIRRQVEQADKVLLIFTETYKRRFTGYEEIGRGLGATFEGVIVTQALYDNGPTNSKFRVVVLNSSDAQFITPELRRFTWYCADSNENYEKLLRWLKGSPAIVPSPIGVGPDLAFISSAEPVATGTTAISAIERTEAHVSKEARDPTPLQRIRTYKAIFLGTFGGYQTIAYGINDKNQIIGHSQLDSKGRQHAFLYSDGRLIDLNPEENSYGWGTAINDAGSVAGFISDEQSTFAFTYREGEFINIGKLLPVGVSSQGSAINRSGTVVGQTTIPNSDSTPFIYRSGQIEHLAALRSAFTAVSGVNDQEQIVGFLNAQPGNYRAFCYQSGRLLDLGGVLGERSQALDINNKGQIVGFRAFSETDLRAFLLENDRLIDLGVSGRSLAEGLNDAGEVVGQDTAETGSPFAFLWTSQDGLLKLNACVENLSDGTSPGFTEIFDAKDINEQGNIAASGNYFDGTKTIQAACMLKRV